MSFARLLRAYLEKKQRETKDERAGWVRKLAGSAAVGLGLGLLPFGCGSESAEESTVQEDSQDLSTAARRCRTHANCASGHYCKKVLGAAVTPKYGVPVAQPVAPKYGVPAPAPAPKYGIMPPAFGQCAPLAECLSDADCASGQRCLGAGPIVSPKYGVPAPAPAPKYGIQPGPCPAGAYCILPPTPQPGICQNECAVDADCAKGEVCVGDAASSCPPGAYCILPPTPRGLCEPKIYPILPPTPSK